MLPSRILRWKRATGVAIGDDRVTAVTVASLPAKAVAVAEAETPLDAADPRALATALRTLREQGAIVAPVTVGLDARAVFFLARTRSGTAEVDAAAMLDAHFSAARPAGGLVGDAAAVGMRGGNYVVLAACRRATAEQVQEGLGPIPHAAQALEPSPVALFRLAGRAASSPRGWKAVVRVLFDRGRGLALLVRGRTLLAWRPFGSTDGHDVDVVAGVVRGLHAHARADLGVPALDGVMLHAAAAHERLAGELRAACGGLEVLLVAPVGLDGRSVALGLALPGRQKSSFAPNLLRELRPPLSVRQIFPYGTAAALTAASFGSWRALASETESCEARAAKAQRRIDAALKAARTKPADLKKARAAALHEAVLASRFLGARAPWARILRELPAHLPETTVLNGAGGRDQLVLPTIDKPNDKVVEKRDFSFQGQMRVPKDAAAPEDVSEINAGVASFETLLQWFPRVDGAEVTRRPGKDDDGATFVVRVGSKKQ